LKYQQQRGSNYTFQGRREKTKKEKKATLVTNRLTTADTPPISKKKTWCHFQRHDEKSFLTIEKHHTRQKKIHLNNI
jgi:hypothetical protein